LQVPDGKELVVTSDTLNADVHFFADQDAGAIAHKALRSKISDILAMGAAPYCYQLCLALHQVDQDWLRGFTAALAADNQKYGVFCSGGDTTSIKGGVSISITAFGLVDKGGGLTRSGAQAGDVILLSGNAGDAYCGLQSLRGEMSDVPEACVRRYAIPDPPAALVPLLGGAGVHAGLDISDGLMADLGHIAAASNLRAVVDTGKIEFSEEVSHLIACGHVTLQELLSGGDDYQLLLSVSKGRAAELIAEAAKFGVRLQAIGRFEQGAAGVIALDKSGAEIDFPRTGWQHF
jgi:thiamine-monophosphate kinase